MRRTYRGRCACGAVRFEATLDIAAGTVKCNCSYCARVRLWSAPCRPDDLRLLVSEAELADYLGSNPVAHHPFCRTCGVHPFDRIEVPNMTGAPYLNVSIACLDDLDVDELMAAPIRFADGLHDTWDAAPAETRHL